MDTRRAPADTSKAFTLVELLVVVSIIALLLSILLPALNQAKDITRTVVCQTQLKQIGSAISTYAAEYANLVTFHDTTRTVGGNGSDAQVRWVGALQSYFGPGGYPMSHRARDTDPNSDWESFNRAHSVIFCPSDRFFPVGNGKAPNPTPRGYWRPTSYGAISATISVNNVKPHSVKFDNQSGGVTTTAMNMNGPTQPGQMLMMTEVDYDFGYRNPAWVQAVTLLLTSHEEAQFGKSTPSSWLYEHAGFTQNWLFVDTHVANSQQPTHPIGGSPKPLRNGELLNWTGDGYQLYLNQFYGGRLPG